MCSNSAARWAQVWRSRMVCSPWAASSLARVGLDSTARRCARISAPSRATRKSSPGVKRFSTSFQGEETSGMPQASASKGRMVGMPGSASSGILQGLKNRGRLAVNDGEIRCLGTEAIDAIDGIEDAKIRWLTAEQSNSSVIVGSLAMVKLIRRVVPGIHPEAEMTRHLTGIGYANTARLLGEVVRVSADETPHTLAIVQSVIGNQGDAWTWVLDNLRRAVEHSALVEGGDHPDYNVLMGFVGTVGRRLGELHEALARPSEDPAFAPVEADAAAVAAWKAGIGAQVTGALDALAAQIDRLEPASRAMAEVALGRRDAVVEAVGRLAEIGRGTLTTRVHGDFHLGQILVSQGDAFIIDFEGEPARDLDERRAKGSPLRDVAGLVRSLDYAAASIAGPEEDASPVPVRERRQGLLETFRREATQAFLQGYGQAYPGGPDTEGRRGGSLLDLMLLEKAAYEISYEVANRPKWLAIPLRGFNALVDRLTGQGRSRVMAQRDVLSGTDAGAIQALVDGRHGDPFSILGDHRAGTDRVVRVFLPGAVGVDVVAREDGSRLGYAGRGPPGRSLRRRRPGRRALSAQDPLARRRTGDRGPLQLRAAARRPRPPPDRAGHALRTRPLPRRPGDDRRGGSGRAVRRLGAERAAGVGRR